MRTSLLCIPVCILLSSCGLRNTVKESYTIGDQTLVFRIPKEYKNLKTEELNRGGGIRGIHNSYQSTVTAADRLSLTVGVTHSSRDEFIEQWKDNKGNLGLLDIDGRTSFLIERGSGDMIQKSIIFHYKGFQGSVSSYGKPEMVDRNVEMLKKVVARFDVK